MHCHCYYDFTLSIIMRLLQIVIESEARLKASRVKPAVGK